MSLPSNNANGQPSIRNFFKPKSPSYAPPPSSVSRTQAQTTQVASPPAPPPPPPPSAATSPPITRQNGPKSPSPLSPPPLSSLSLTTKPANLHPQATISPILPDHIPALRRITSLLLPVNYPDSFYQRLSDPLFSGAFSRVLLWNDDPASAAAPKVIGGLVCRPEPSPFVAASSRPSQFQILKPTTPDAQPNALYIQSLVLLSPYRSLGLAAALLDDAVRAAAASEFRCGEVYAHVWTDNDDGLRWYLARGFAKHGQVNGYYFKLKPDSAWIVRRQIAASPVSAALGLSANGANANTDTDTNTNTNTTASDAIAPSATAAAANLLKQQAPTPPALAATTNAGPGMLSPPLGPPRSSSGPSPNRSPGPGTSFQTARPDMEWNDLPADMHSTPASNASSRSSSAAPKKKRDRAYPAAAFGK